MFSSYIKGEFEIPVIGSKAEGKERESFGSPVDEEGEFEVKEQEQGYDYTSDCAFDMEGESLW